MLPTLQPRGYAPITNTKDNPPCNTLFIGNLGDGVNEAEIRGLFRCGSLPWCDVRAHLQQAQLGCSGPAHCRWPADPAPCSRLPHRCPSLAALLTPHDPAPPCPAAATSPGSSS